jgi:hypothetical protein
MQFMLRDIDFGNKNVASALFPMEGCALLRIP